MNLFSKWFPKKQSAPVAPPVSALQPPAPPLVATPAPAPAIPPSTQEKPMSFSLSSILKPVENLFIGAFTKPLTTLEASAKAELTSVEQSIVTFATSDLGKLAVDAVGLVPAKLTGDDAFAVAKTQFVADAKAAGHDLETLGSGVVDWAVQTAYTYAAGVAANLNTVKIPTP